MENLPPDLSARYDALKRREKLRQALMEQTLTPTQTQYTGGPYSRAVPYSPIQGGLKMIQAALLNKRGKNINKDLQQLGEEYSQGGQDEVSRVIAQAYGGDAPYKMSPDETFAGERIPGLQTTYEADPRKAALMGAGSEYQSAQRVSDAILDMQSNQSRRGGYFKEVDVVLNGIPTKVLLNARTGQITDLFGKPVAMTPELEGQITPTLQGSQISQGPYGPTVLPSYSMPVDPKYSSSVQEEIKKSQSRGKITGEDQGQAQIDAPKSEASAQESLRLTDKLRNHPGMKDVIGFPDNPLVAKGLVPGTDAADFRAILDQLTGRTFMEIYPTLKGGGQITEIEGQKGQEAINRMRTSTSEKAFLEALDDFDAEVRRLNEIVKKRAGQESNIQPTQDKGTTRMRFDAQGNLIE